MKIVIAGHELESKRFKNEDGLGFHVYWRGKVPAKPLTTWGRGEEQLGDKPMPVALLSNTDDPPLPRQQASLEWLLNNLDEVATRLQALCEDCWGEYYWEGNEMEDDEEYFIEGLRIPPGREGLEPALLVFDLEQDWEMEHGFYLIVNPANKSGDTWTTWDGLHDLGLLGHDEDEEHFGEGTLDDAIAKGDPNEVAFMVEQGAATPEDTDEALIWLIAEFQDIAVFNVTVHEPNVDLKRTRKHAPVGPEHSVRTFAARLLDFVKGERDAREGESPELVKFMQQKYDEAMAEHEDEEVVLDSIERIQFSLNNDD